MRHPTRIGVVGPPGVGKSTYVRRDSKRLHAAGIPHLVVDLDPGPLSLSGVACIGVHTGGKEGARNPVAWKSLWFTDGITLSLVMERYRWAMQRVTRAVEVLGVERVLVDLPGVVRGKTARRVLVAAIELFRLDLLLVVGGTAKSSIEALAGVDIPLQDEESTAPTIMSEPERRREHCRRLRSLFGGLPTWSLADTPVDRAAQSHKAAGPWVIAGLERPTGELVGRGLVSVDRSSSEECSSEVIRARRKELRAATCIRVGVSSIDADYALSEPLSTAQRRELSQQYRAV